MEDGRGGVRSLDRQGADRVDRQTSRQPSPPALFPFNNPESVSQPTQQNKQSS